MLRAPVQRAFWGTRICPDTIKENGDAVKHFVWSDIQRAFFFCEHAFASHTRHAHQWHVKQPVFVIEEFIAKTSARSDTVQAIPRHALASSGGEKVREGRRGGEVLGGEYVSLNEGQGRYS